MAAKTNMTMGIEFLDRSLRTTSILLLIFLPFGLYYFGVFPTLAVFSGGVWGIINLVFISALVRTVIREGDVNKMRALGLASIKFPLIYASGFFLLKIPQFDPLFLLIGSSAVMAVIVLKVLGRAMLQIEDNASENKISHPA